MSRLPPEGEQVAQLKQSRVDVALHPSLWRASVTAARRILLIYVRYPTWILPLLAWPVLFPFSYVFTARALAGPANEALGAFGSLAGTTDIVGFITIGTTFWMWFNMILWDLGYSLREEQMRGTLESSWLAPVPKMYLPLGALMAQALMGLFTVTVSLLTLYLVWGLRIRGSLGALASAVLLSVPSIYGLGLAFASLVLIAKEVNAFVFFVRGLMTVFCGIAYPVAALPSWMQSVSRWLPLTYSVQAVRKVAAGAGLGAIAGELRYLAVSGAVLLLLGLGCFEWVKGRLVRTGTLGQY